MSTELKPPFVTTITLPKNTQWDGQRATQFINQMLLGFESLTFRIMATAHSMVWQLLDQYKRDHRLYQSAIRASYPEATVNYSEFRRSDENAEHYPIYRFVVKYQQLTKTFLAPITYATDICSPDPLSHITELMGALVEGERIIYYIIVEGTAAEAYRIGQKQLSQNIYDGSLTGFFAPYKVDKYNGNVTRVCGDKLAQRLYHASVFIQIDSPDPDRLNQLLAIDNQMVSFDRHGFGALGWIDDGQGVITVTDTSIDEATRAIYQYDHITSQEDGLFRKNKLKQQIDLILEPREIASLWHLPHEEFTAHTIQWAYGNVRIPPVLRGKRTGTFIGVNSYAGHDEPIYIPDRTGHISIIGQSGVGKSNLLHHIIHQDIASGHGVALIDPHGELVNDVLRYSIPSEREKDVVIIDIADEQHPAPLNLLSVPSGVDQGNAVGQLMGILDRLYDFNSTPTVADATSACLAILLHDERATIRDVGRLFRDAEYRASLMQKATNIAALEFWERFNDQKSGHDQIIRPVLWRLRSLYGNNILYPIVCHPDTLDIGSIVKHNKILLVSLKAEEARIPMREQHLLGLIILTQLQQHLMVRPKGSPMFYIHVDELQHFLITTFSTLLSEARKNQVSLTTANQYFRQLTGDTLDAIFGNVGTMIAFQMGLADAKLVEPYFAPGFDAEHLMHLNKYTAAMTTRYKEQSLTAFSMHTLSPISQGKDVEKAQKRMQYLRSLSRAQYTPKTRQEVLARVDEKYTSSAKFDDQSLYYE